MPHCTAQAIEYGGYLMGDETCMTSVPGPLCVTARTAKFERGISRAARAIKTFCRRMNLILNGRRNRKQFVETGIWPGKRRFQP